MLKLFRSLLHSRFGVVVTLIFLAVIAVAFAAGDVVGLGGLTSLGGSDAVAKVGNRKISAATLSSAISSAVEEERQQNPKFTAKDLIAQNDVDPLLSGMINRLAVSVWGAAHGVMPSNRLIDSEITKLPAFRGADGNFSETTYRQLIQQRGFTDAQVRDDLSQSLSSKLLLSAAQIGAVMPPEVTQRLAGVITETRKGQIATLPAALFAPKGEPSEADIQAYYGAHTGDYIRPERRTIRYAEFTDAVLKTVPAPTAAEIAARYSADKDKYAAKETRKITQLILPTEAGAKAVAAEVEAGKSLEAAAQAKGLATSTISVTSKDELAGQSSADVASAVYGAATGKLVGPVKSGLGWHVLRLDSVITTPGKTLDQARAEIVNALTEENRRKAIAAFSEKVEDELDGGASLSDVAKEMGLTLSETQPLLAGGQVYGKPGESAPPVLARVIPTAFAMEGEGQPQLAEVVPNQAFVIFDVAAITPAAPAPLAEIHDQVASDFKLARGAEAAHAAALKAQAAIKQGKSFAEAMAGLGVALPPIDQVNIGREQLQAMAQQGGVAPPVQLLFTMGKGATRLMGAPHNRGWYVIRVDEVIPGTVKPDDPRLPGLQGQLAQVVANEHMQELASAMRRELKVERNPAAVRAVIQRLTGN